jgi:dTDP-4-dehydrorhamnose 3,5-epimerase
MKLIETNLPDVAILEPKIWGDERGFFYESFNENLFEDLGIKRNWVQDNHSKSSKGVLRGLHYQLQMPQAKLVRVTSGLVYDVVVDVRHGSPTFGQWAGVELSAENKRMFFIPEGFAHGFYTMSAEAEFIYKCSDYYYPAGERGIIWNDPELAIPWPLDQTEPLVSAKDLGAIILSQIAIEDLPKYKG